MGRGRDPKGRFRGMTTYSAFPFADGLIVRWRIEGSDHPIDQIPPLVVKAKQRLIVDPSNTPFGGRMFCAVIEGPPGRFMVLPFTPDTPPKGN